MIKTYQACLAGLAATYVVTAGLGFFHVPLNGYMIPAIGVGCISSFLLSASAFTDYYIDLVREERASLLGKKEKENFDKQLNKISLDGLVNSIFIGATCAVTEFMLYFLSSAYSPMPYN
jgi:hypothetical protein